MFRGWILLLASLLTVPALRAQFSDAMQPVAATSIPAAALVEPAGLAAELTAKGKQPLLLQVGSHMLYEQAHIPGSEYVGAAAQPAGLEALRQRVRGLDRKAPIVIYCGCCPWDRCPNVGTAYQALVSMGFRQVRVLHIASNFGADWVAHGYPVAR